jgi:alpha-galactosidase
VLDPIERIVAVVDETTHAGPVTPKATVVGPLEVGLDPGDPTAWWVVNRSGRPVDVRSVALVRPVRSHGPLRMFCHGYQSWTACTAATFGVDQDPSHANTSGIELLSGAHHADQRPAMPGELRSELVTVLAAPDESPVLLGALGGDCHDTTFRLRPTDDPAGGTGRQSSSEGAELHIEAFLGGAQLAPGERRDLHPVHEAAGDDVPELLDRWATLAGEASSARVDAPYQVGWCSWYHYFHDVTEADIDTNLALAGTWPFDVFQLDDGFQSAIGDWLDTNDKFPSSLTDLAARIRDAGYQPGLWIAPFIVAPDSMVATEHPEWLARLDERSSVPGMEAGDPLPGMFNPPWGGGMGGIMWTLDTSHPEVIAHLEHVARSLRQAGFSYLKLDFTYAPSFDGVYHDASLTPAQRVRAGYDAVRRGAGDDAFILGCGAPLGHVIGVVDANRIGSDVAPSWDLPPEGGSISGYEDAEPATLNAYRDTVARSFLHRRLWLNDPDCLMLRTDQTDLSAAQARTWAHAIALSGGLALVSDDLGLVDADGRALLDEVIELGRDADEAARSGSAPRCEDLLVHSPATTVTAAGRCLVTDPATGLSTLAEA